MFFGGGTPSLFPPEEFARLIGALKQRIDFADDAEITLEANPGTIERGRFAGYAEAGINRVSLGAQSFDRARFKAGPHSFGRRHASRGGGTQRCETRQFQSGSDVCAAAADVAGSAEDVQIACSLEPAHISYYQLTLEPGTVFHSRPPALPDEDAAWQIQIAGQKMLAESGYAQYEVSAYAKTARDAGTI